MAPLCVSLRRKLRSTLGSSTVWRSLTERLHWRIAIRAAGLSGEVIVPSWTSSLPPPMPFGGWESRRSSRTSIPRRTASIPSLSARGSPSARTGILAVHLWGRAAPVDELQTIASEHGLALLFDAAHAFGVSLRGTMVGNFAQPESELPTTKSSSTPSRVARSSRTMMNSRLGRVSCAASGLGRRQCRERRHQRQDERDFCRDGAVEF